MEKTAKKQAIKKGTKEGKKASAKIVKSMTIGEAVQKYPETAFVMMKHGLHCVGCHVAAWETIEQGALGHGMNEEQLQSMVDEMNKAIETLKKKK